MIQERHRVFRMLSWTYLETRCFADCLSVAKKVIITSHDQDR